MTCSITCTCVVLRLRPLVLGRVAGCLPSRNFLMKKTCKPGFIHPRQGFCCFHSHRASLTRSAACGSGQSQLLPSICLCYLLQYLALLSYTIPSFCFNLVLCPICQDDFKLYSHPQRYLQPLSVTSRLNKHSFSSTIATNKNTGKLGTEDRLIFKVNFQ